jgi:hypothetical protein
LEAFWGSLEDFAAGSFYETAFRDGPCWLVVFCQRLSLANMYPLKVGVGEVSTSPLRYRGRRRCGGGFRTKKQGCKKPPQEGEAVVVVRY